MVDTEKGRHILTLYEKRVDPKDLPFFLGLMEHLAARGISCPAPVRDQTDSMLGILAARPAAVITFLDGLSPRHPKAHHCHEVGRALAKLHAAGAGFRMQRQNALGVPGWRPLFEKFRADANSIAPGLAEEITAELKALEQNWPQNLPSGIIHADLFDDNVFFLGDRLSGIIDFYFACNDAFAYDVAICLNAWCFDDQHHFDRNKGHALLSGYQAVRQLTEAEHAQLPILARGSALRFLLTRAYDWLNTPTGALVARKDPGEYLAKLRFHRSVTDASMYGLEAKS
jgi:homoserine kinase type II